jgi:hypothetical protein
LRKQLKAEIPDDLINVLIDRALHSLSPLNDSWIDESSDDEAGHRDRLLERGINTARGQSVEVLADILVYDADGRRIALVVPVLAQLASDPSPAVLACTAHLIAACLRHAREEAVAAFHLLTGADDRLLASRYVETLIVYVCNADTDAVRPVIQRMLLSTHQRVRKAGGRLAAYAGLEVAAEQLLAAARASNDPAVRASAAEVCAARLPHTANVVHAGDAVRQFVDEEDEEVRKAVAGIAAALRNRALQPFEPELTALIDSLSFTLAVSQLLITLERAPDRVDNLILRCARRFVEVHGTDASAISTAAAGDAREVGRLLLRAYAQAAEANSRGTVLDLLDSVLASGAYGVAELVDAVDR